MLAALGDVVVVGPGDTVRGLDMSSGGPLWTWDPSPLNRQWNMGLAPGGTGFVAQSAFTDGDIVVLEMTGWFTPVTNTPMPSNEMATSLVALDAGSGEVAWTQPPGEASLLYFSRGPPGEHRTGRARDGFIGSADDAGVLRVS